jgi:hypothetical protein
MVNMYNKFKYQSGGRPNFLKSMYMQLAQSGIINMPYDQFASLPPEEHQKMMSQLSNTNLSAKLSDGGTVDSVSGQQGQIAKGFQWNNVLQGMGAQASGTASSMLGNLISGDAKADTVRYGIGNVTGKIGQGIATGSQFGPIGMAVGAGLGLIGGVADTLRQKEQYKKGLRRDKEVENTGELDSSYNPNIRMRYGGNIQDFERAFARSRANLRPDQYSFTGRKKISTGSTGIMRAGIDNYRQGGMLNTGFGPNPMGTSYPFPTRFFNERKYGGGMGPRLEMQDSGQAPVEVESGEVAANPRGQFNPRGVTLHGGADAESVSSRGMVFRGAKHGELNDAGTEGIPVSMDGQTNPDGMYIYSAHLRPDGTKAKGKGDTPRDSVAGMAKPLVDYNSKAEKERSKDRFYNNPKALEHNEKELAYLKDRAEEGKFMHGLKKMLGKKDRSFSEIMDYIKQNNPESETVEGVDPQSQEVLQQALNKDMAQQEEMPMPNQGQMPQEGAAPMPEQMPQMKKGGLTGKDRKIKGSSKNYPMIKSGDFAGGNRSYPIPTKEDAIDALRLAGLHGRSDVRTKVYNKYPSLKKQEGGEVNFLDDNNTPELYNENYNLNSDEFTNETIMRKGGKHQPTYIGGYENQVYYGKGGSLPQWLYNARARAIATQQNEMMMGGRMGYGYGGNMNMMRRGGLMSEDEQMEMGYGGRFGRANGGYMPMSPPPPPPTYIGGYMDMYVDRNLQQGGRMIPTTQDAWRNRPYSSPVNMDYYGEPSAIQARTTSPYMYGGRAMAQRGLTVPGMQKEVSPTLAVPTAKNKMLDPNMSQEEMQYRASLPQQPVIGQRVPNRPSGAGINLDAQPNIGAQEAYGPANLSRGKYGMTPEQIKRLDAIKAGTITRDQLTDMDYKLMEQDMSNTTYRYGGMINNRTSPRWLGYGGYTNFRSGGRMMAQDGSMVVPGMITGKAPQGMQKTPMDKAIYDYANKERGIARPIIEEVGQFSDMTPDEMKGQPLGQYRGFDVMKDTKTIEDVPAPQDPTSKTRVIEGKEEMDQRESSNYADRRAAALSMGESTTGKPVELTEYINSTLGNVFKSGLSETESEGGMGVIAQSGVEGLKKAGFSDDQISNYTFADVEDKSNPITKYLLEETSKAADRENVGPNRPVDFNVADRALETVSRDLAFTANKSGGVSYRDVAKKLKGKVPEYKYDMIANKLNKVIRDARKQGIDPNDATAWQRYIEQSEIMNDPIVREYYRSMDKPSMKEVRREKKGVIEAETASVEVGGSMMDLTMNPNTGKKISFEQAMAFARDKGLEEIFYDGEPYEVPPAPTPQGRRPDLNFIDEPQVPTYGYTKTFDKMGGIPYTDMMPKSLAERMGRKMAGTKTTSPTKEQTVKETRPKGKGVKKTTYSRRAAGQRKMGGIVRPGKMQRGQQVQFQYGGKMYSGTVKYYDPVTGDFELE